MSSEQTLTLSGMNGQTSGVAAARAKVNFDPTIGESTFDKFITRKRVAISLVIFTSVMVIDVLLLDVRPRSLVDFTDIGTVVGLVGVVLGLFARSWAAGTLHKNASLTQVGPYSITRNPLYVGSFLMMIGFCALVQDLYTIWIIAGPMALLYWFQVRIEERRLERLYPQDWPLYAATTPRFLPRPWKMVRGGGWSLAQWLSNREYQAIIASAVGLGLLVAWRVWMW